MTDDSREELKKTRWSSQHEIGRARAATDLSWELFVSSDQGTTWEKITPRKDNTNKKELSLVNLLNATTQGKKDIKKEDTKSSHMSTLYAPLKIMVTENKLMLIDHLKHYYSSNFGKTWVTVDTNPLGIAHAIVMTDEDTYYRSGNYGIHRTTDGGESWHQFNNGLVNTDVWQLITVNGTLYANSIDGFVFSTDKGNSWNPVIGDTGFITRIMESNGNIIVRDDKYGTPRFFYLSPKDNRLSEMSEIPNLDKVEPRKENPLLIRPTGFWERDVSHGVDPSLNRSLVVLLSLTELYMLNTVINSTDGNQVILIGSIQAY